MPVEPREKQMSNHAGRFWTKSVGILMSIGVLVGVPILMSPVAAQEVGFDVNDLSYLWPAPVSEQDVAALITAEEAIGGGAMRLWPKSAFDQLIQIAQSVTIETSGGTTARIDFTPFNQQFAQQAVWKIVAFRVDASAPGGDPVLIGRFGSTPQIRIVLQPVTVNSGVIKVHDVAAHLAFRFTKGTEAGTGRAVPDTDLFREVLTELKALKADAGQAGIITDGPLGVHPALQARVPGFAAKVRAFLKGRLSEERLTEMAFMGIDGREPWIFFLMRKGADGTFVQTPLRNIGGAMAHMLTFKGGVGVMPTPMTTNAAPHGGVSTATLFMPGAAGVLDTPVFKDVPRPLLRDIPDVIANPRTSHLLNTDCVSCHTETGRRRDLKAISTDVTFRFARPAAISGVNEANLPQTSWNLRNFGWFQGRDGRIQPTVTMRTANEAAESAEFVNREYFASRQAPIESRRSVVAMQEAVASPLTLVMSIKSQKDFVQLKTLIDELQKLPPDRNPITVALTRLGNVHFARFVFIGERQFAVITTYDGAFDDYIDAFINAIGAVFDKLLAHVVDAPPLPVSEHRKEFLDFVRKNDLTAVPPFYSAYPRLKVLDILTLQKQQNEAQSASGR